MSDSTLRCTRCGRVSAANFTQALRAGWARCCGLTMLLVSTEADVSQAVTDVLAGQLPTGKAKHA